MADLEEIKRRNSIEATAQRYGVELQASGRRFRAQCPFHDDHTPSLFLYPEDGRFKCYGAGCGLHGDVIDFVGFMLFDHEWDKTDASQFKAVLDDLEGGPSGGTRRPGGDPKQRPTPVHASVRAEGPPDGGERRLTDDILSALDLTARLYHENLISLGDGDGTPLRYLYDRGFTWKTIRDGQFGYCPPYSELLQVAGELMAVSQEALLAASVLRRKRSGLGVYETFYGRITLTDRDYSFRVVHLIGRKFPGANQPEESPKYLSLPDWPKPLYGLESLPYRGTGPVMIVEAPFDMLTLRQWGYDAVAVTGADMKTEHADRLRELKRPLVIVPDTDQAGLDASERWQSQLLAGEGVRVLRLPDRVGNTSIDDVNRLAQVDKGKEIFADLVRRL
jgi:DNA primase